MVCRRETLPLLLDDSTRATGPLKLTSCSCMTRKRHPRLITKSVIGCYWSRFSGMPIVCTCDTVHDTTVEASFEGATWKGEAKTEEVGLESYRAGGGGGGVGWGGGGTQTPTAQGLSGCLAGFHFLRAEQVLARNCAPLRNTLPVHKFTDVSELHGWHAGFDPKILHTSMPWSGPTSQHIAA